MMGQAWMGAWENNASEYLMVGDGAGSIGTVIESIKKAKWGVRGRGGPGRGKGTWGNNASEYIRVGDGAGSMGTAIENTKKAKWRVGG